MITNPDAIKFCNESLRPIAELARDFIIKATPIIQEWQQINSEFPNDATEVDDGREAEGISRLTGADVHALMTIIGNLNFVDTAAAINKPCVREPYDPNA